MIIRNCLNVVPQSWIRSCLVWFGVTPGQKGKGTEVKRRRGLNVINIGVMLFMDGPLFAEFENMISNLNDKVCGRIIFKIN